MNRLFRRANKRVSLGGAAALLMGMALVGQTLGFLRTRLIATNVTSVNEGASDAFFAAFAIPDFFYFTIAAGALGVAFIPFLADKLERGDKRGAWEITSSLINVLALAMLAVAVIILTLADPIIRSLFPKLEGENLRQAITVMRLLAFNPLFFSISGIITSLQQTYGRFFFYAISPLVYNMAIIVSIYMWAGSSLGVVGLGIGAAAGGFLQLLTSLLGLTGLGFRYRPVIKWRNADFKSVLNQLPPRSLDQGIDQVNSLVELNRANALAVGAVSHYTFALTLHNVPIILLGNSIAIAAFPRLTARLSQNRPDLFRKEFTQILRAMIWMAMPVIVVSYFARGYLARLIFGDVAPQVALIFGYLTVAILFRIIYSMLSRYFYAHKDSRTPLLVSIFAIGLNIFLAFTLARPSAYGISGLALAQSIVAVCEVAVLFLIILVRNFNFFNAEFWRGIVRIISVTGFSVLASYMMVQIFPLTLGDRGIVTLGTKLGSIAFVTIAVHLVLSAIFGLEEAKNVLQKTKEFIFRPVKIS